MNAFAPGCTRCRPTAAVVPAMSHDHALALLKAAQAVYVCANVPSYRIFRVDRDEALQELSRPMHGGRTPDVTLHLPHFVFIGNA